MENYLNKSSFKYILEFIALSTISLILLYTPYISDILILFETFFHEMSHAIAILLTGGEVYKTNISFDTSGYVQSLGGNKFISAWFGYSGAIIFGILIYILNYINYTFYIGFLIIISIIGALNLFYFDSTIEGMVITVLLLGYFLISLGIPEKFSKFINKLISTFISISSLKAIVYLYTTKQPNDSTFLAELTGIPSFFWITSWLLFGIFMIIITIKYVYKKEHQRELNRNIQ